MSDGAQNDVLGDLVRQLTAIAAIRRRLVRELPQGLGNGSAVLAVLAHCGETQLRAVAHRLDCDLSVVSRQVGHLEQQALVVRRTNPEDRRSSLVSITPQGRSLVEALLQFHTDLIAAATADWAPEELTTLTALLERLRDGLSHRTHHAQPRGDATGRTSGQPTPAPPPHHQVETRD